MQHTKSPPSRLPLENDLTICKKRNITTLYPQGTAPLPLENDLNICKRRHITTLYPQGTAPLPLENNLTICKKRNITKLYPQGTSPLPLENDLTICKKRNICNSFSLTQSQDRYIAANICPIVKIPLKRNVSSHTIDKAEGESILLHIQQVLQAEPFQ